jgi:hypothetical protein
MMTLAACHAAQVLNTGTPTSSSHPLLSLLSPGTTPQVTLSHGTLYLVDRHDVTGTPLGSVTPQAWPTLVWSQYRLSLSQTKGPSTTCANTADWGTRWVC